MVRFILCMIVGNEAKIIRRCIESVLPIVSAISICANGSDQTAEIVEQVMAEKKVVGQVVRTIWKNFAHNRSESFEEVRKLARKLDYDLTETYGLLMDADMVLRIRDAFQKDSSRMKAVGYEIYQFNHGSGNRYLNTRFIRLDVNWFTVMYTHEYWDNDINVGSDRFEGAWIDDYNDGGSKSDKYTRDYGLIHLGLKEDKPERRIRYWFYLGRTCHALGNRARREAIQLRAEIGRMRKKLAEQKPAESEEESEDDSSDEESPESQLETITKELADAEIRQRKYYAETLSSYALRIGAGGYYSEVWQSLYESAAIHKKEGRLQEAVYTYHLAFDFDPRRAETLYRLSRFFTNREKDNLAYDYAKRASLMSYPFHEGLFVERKCYQRKILFALMMAAYKIGNTTESMLAAEELAMRRDMPEQNRGYAIRDRRLLAQQLKNKDGNPRIFEMDFAAPVEAGTGYIRSSILKTLNGYLMLYSPDGREYSLAQTDQKVNVTTREGFNLRSSAKIAGLAADSEEIFRLIEYQQRIWVMNADRLCRLSGRKPRADGTVAIDLTVDLAFGHLPMPFVDDERLLLVEGLDPTIVSELVPATGEITQIKSHRPELVFRGFQAVAGPTRFALPGAVPSVAG